MIASVKDQESITAEMFTQQTEGQRGKSVINQGHDNSVTTLRSPIKS